MDDENDISDDNNDLKEDCSDINDDNEIKNEDLIADADEHTQVVSSADIASKIDVNLSYYENYIITTIIELFTKEGQSKLSSFLRKKMIIKLDSIQSGSFEDIDPQDPKVLTLNFGISPPGKYGMIAYDFAFLDFVINLLYGGSVTNDTQIMHSLGKSSFKIVSKISELFLIVMQEIMIQQLKISVNLANVSLQPRSFFKQETAQNYHKFCFSVLLDSLVCNLILVFPADLFASTERETEALTADVSSPEHTAHELAVRQPIFDEAGKKSLIDSSVTISVNLPPLKLKLKDIVHLQAGDILPIGDPTLVFVALNKKTLFKAFSGQSNQKRVIKIIEKV